MNKTFLIAFSLLALLSQDVALATEGEHGPRAHEDVLELQLNDGKRWATDEPLRMAMENIQDVLNPALLANSEALDSADYSRMADSIESEINFMVQNCKLPPAADAELHKLVVMLGQGVHEMRAGPERREGVSTAVKALELYGRFFEHEGWQYSN